MIKRFLNLITKRKFKSLHATNSLYWLGEVKESECLFEKYEDSKVHEISNCTYHI